MRNRSKIYIPNQETSLTMYIRKAAYTVKEKRDAGRSQARERSASSHLKSITPQFSNLYKAQPEG